MQERKILDDYVQMSKEDFILRIIIALLCIFIWCIFSKLKNMYCFVILVFFPFVFVLNRWKSYKNMKQIKEYICKNNLLDKIGKIIFWNEEYYLLTENYIVILKKNRVNHFTYNDIIEISKQMKWRLNRNSGASEYLHIKLKNKEEYKILIWTTYMVNENFKDISEILLEKNKKILVTDKK